MIEIRAFRALRYVPDKVGGLAGVVAPPYDVIGPAQLDRLYKRNRHNVVRLILNREADPYSAAAAELREWKSTGILRLDERPALYYYVQNFRLPDGSARERGGVIGLVRLSPFSEGNILPHERTFARAKEDRLKLLRACRANLSPIFGLYIGHAEVLTPVREHAAAHSPVTDVSDDVQERHRVWRIEQPELIAAVTQGLRDATVLIADGHHRYETALAYRDECIAAGQTDPDAPHQFVLMCLACMHDPGLVILPTHRVLTSGWGSVIVGLAERLTAYFEIESLGHGEDALRQLSIRFAARQRGFAMKLSAAGSLYFCCVRDAAAVERALGHVPPAVRNLDVTVLDEVVLRDLLGIDVTSAAQEGRLAYTHNDREAVGMVESGADAAFLVRAPGVGAVQAASLAGATMPEKSTYFYPKLFSGLVFYDLTISTVGSSPCL